MATDSEPALNIEGTNNITRWVEVASKAVAVLVVATYASGFLVTSLHQSTFGFTETNPFRPRIVVAGAWFLFLLSLPLGLISSIEKIKTLSWTKLALLAYPYYTACFPFAILAFSFFDFSSATSSASPVHWWRIVPPFLLLMLLTLLIELKRVPERISALASVGFTGYYLGSSLWNLDPKRFDFSTLALWFFLIGVAALVELKVRATTFTSGGWTKSVFLVFGAVFFFATYYYPHLKASWGGGAPVPATVYFSKDSLIKPGQSAVVYLLGENDSGIYVAAKGEQRGTFIPRNAVALIHFSDASTSSALLK